MSGLCLEPPCSLGSLLSVSLMTLPGEGDGTPLQYSCLENPMDGGAWWAAVHGVAKSRTRLSDFTFTFHFHALEKEMALPNWRLCGPASVSKLKQLYLAVKVWATWPHHSSKEPYHISCGRWALCIDAQSLCLKTRVGFRDLIIRTDTQSPWWLDKIFIGE